ncbi:ROK family transcriptional regulator [Nocardioides insulae]|uniref:ROK family transcriptional regulator n=1 Tax=Nocardioides insulae TaxID=394734 RepID=UPI0003F5A290|nr:ROK family transcriptional regulator [Nocardioides insulae]
MTVSGTEQLRRLNTALVLRSLRRDGPASRSELARRTGLAKTTVGVIVSSLAGSGAVSEGTVVSEGRGRPSRPVSMSGERLLALGLELNVDYVSAVLLDLAGTVRRHEHRPIPSGASGRVEALLDLAGEVAGAVEGRLLGARVAVPGLVRGDDATIAWTPNLRLAGPELADRVRARIGDVLHEPCAVTVGNDANAAAYAESRRGVAVGVDQAVYLTGTVGIGAGFVVDGRLLRGVDGFAGEVGHLPLGDPADRCGCGRSGCWETAIGLHAMLSRVGLGELATPMESARMVVERAGEPAVAHGLDRLGRDLGRGLATLAQLVNPEVVVLGGYFAPLGEQVLQPARAALDAALPTPALRRPELRLSGLGLEAAATGAAELALDVVFTGDVPL